MKQLFIAVALAFAALATPAAAQCVPYELVDLRGAVRQPSPNGFVLVFVANADDAACLRQMGAREICAECSAWANISARGVGQGPIRQVRSAPGTASVFKVPRGQPIMMPATLRGPVAGCDTAQTRSQESWYLRPASQGAREVSAETCTRCRGPHILWVR